VVKYREWLARRKQDTNQGHAKRAEMTPRPAAPDVAPSARTLMSSIAHGRCDRSNLIGSSSLGAVRAVLATGSGMSATTVDRTTVQTSRFHHVFGAGTPSFRSGRKPRPL
jgi:hypothetical protein